MTTQQRNSVLLYLLLGVIALASAVFHVRSVEQIFPQWFGIERAEWPFLLDAEDQPHFLVHFPQEYAQAAGLKEGDQLIAINGIPIQSRSIFADLLLSSKPGSTWDIAFQRQAADQSSRLLLQETKTRNDPLLLLVYVAMPVFCVALGLWVAAVRVHDVRAWLLLFFLLSAGTAFDNFPYFWGPGLRVFGTLYRRLFDSGGIGCLFLLGMYFPEPFPRTSRWPWWRWLAWVVLPLWAIISLADAISFVIEFYSVRAAIPFNVLLARLPEAGQLIYSVLAVSFLACLAAKFRFASSQDVKRRLRVLSMGSALGLLPVSAFFTIQRLKGVTDEFFPGWVKIPIFVSIALLPITFAYVIVVQRALDVRVVLRQGLQYTLASRGIILLQLALSVSLFFFAWWLITSHSVSAPVTAAAVATGIAALVLLQLGRTRLALWIDRRFFRDAYNAEQILNDLSDQVRTMVEVNPLLEVVAARIASSLHVKQVAVMLREDEMYRPCHAIGFGGLPVFALPVDAATIQLLSREKQPTRVYAEDTHSWLNGPGVRPEEQRQVALLHPELLLPLSVRDDLLGFMSLGQKLSEAPYSSSDLRLLRSVSTQTGLALEVARLTTAIGQEIAVRERLNRELEIAREVQERLFPQRPPAIPGLDYGGLCRPAREVGGDYYDFLGLPGGKLGIAIGDVSGKGIGAALMMANLCASLRGHAPIAETLPRLIGTVSNLVYEASSANRYATFFYSEFDPATLQLSFVNAGHNPPVIVRSAESDFQVFRLTAGGPPIGLLPNAPYEGGIFLLKPGDRIVLFTDGISESMNKDDEEWGEENLIDVAKCRCSTAGETVHRIMSAAQAFAGDAPQHDDMTVVALQVLSVDNAEAGIVTASRCDAG
jgi:phosphoserine phosphatase RsbU/P